MWHRFWPTFLALTLGCAESEADDYEPQACAGCDWVVPFGSRVDAQRLVSDGEQVYWLQRWTKQLLRVPVGGGEPEAVADWLELSRGLLVDDGAIYSCEADPPEAFAYRLVRIDKTTFARTTLSSGNVSSMPTLQDDTFYYFERSADGNQLWQQPSQGGERQAVVATGGAPFPSSPVPLNGEIAWCAATDAGITLFRYSKESDTTTYELSGETSCPELVVMNGRLFSFSGRDGGTLLELGLDGGAPVKSGITADESSRSWSASSVAGNWALLTQLGGTRLLLIDEQGSVLWSQDAPFPILYPAASDAHSVFAGGDRGIARFALPSEAQP